MRAVLSAAVVAVAASLAAQNAAAPHWAFAAPQSRTPAVADDAWCRDAIDRYVLARLRQQGLAPSPAADRATLLRRVHLALTGLPPTDAEQRAFAADARDDAYERVVDDLLQRPACAEHMATAWLDLAHFADTYGYQSDFECRTWPWRDWLLRALDQDLPYDAFVRQLLAGDLLADATQDTRIATAFFRLHRQTNEGGSIPEEWRHEYIADRVDTFGTTFLGLTVGCARCHDHKSDPIAQRDYYSLGSFFAVDEAGLYPYSTGVTPKPALKLTTAEQERELARLRAAKDAAEAALATAIAQAKPVHAELPPPVLSYTFDDLQGRKAMPDQTGKQTIDLPDAVRVVDGRPRDWLGLGAPPGNALQFDGDAIVTVPDAPAVTRDDAFALAFWLWCPDTKARAVVLHTSNYTEDADTQGYQVLIEDGRLSWQLVHHWPGSAIALQTKEPLPLQQWVHVAVSYDGSSRAAGMQILLDTKPAPTEVVRDHLDGPATVRALQLGGRDRDRGFAGGRIDDLRIWTRALVPGEALWPIGDHLPDEPEEPSHIDTIAGDAAVQRATAAAHDARKALHDFEASLPELMVLAQNRYPRQRFVLKRGAYDQPDQQQPVGCDVPAAIAPFAAELPRDRRGLADWLLSPQHPLTARVQVNRLWAQCFGQGLVRTPENFGKLGEVPLQQELLDALAVDFRASGWHNKVLLRRIVTSATFRQRSLAEPALRERDPDNRLLARGPSFRLSAEALRDQALAASGLLHEQLGGPSVKPWQPPGLWRDAGVGWGGADYTPDTGPNAHRRSLYTYRKRTAPPPNLQLFDAPSRESCTARRLVTDTPLQSLAMLNDPVFVECAQALAARVGGANAQADVDARITAVFAALTARAPRPAELRALHALFDDRSKALAADANGCQQIAGAPATAEQAALVLVANTLLASDAVLVLR